MKEGSTCSRPTGGNGERGSSLRAPSPLCPTSWSLSPAGVARLDIGVFVLASLLSRGFRFYVEATLLWYFGPAVRGLIERHLVVATVIGLLLVVGVFLLLRFAA